MDCSTLNIWNIRPLLESKWTNCLDFVAVEGDADCGDDAVEGCDDGEDDDGRFLMWQ